MSPTEKCQAEYQHVEALIQPCLTLHMSGSSKQQSKSQPSSPCRPQFSNTKTSVRIKESLATRNHIYKSISFKVVLQLLSSANLKQTQRLQFLNPSIQAGFGFHTGASSPRKHARPKAFRENSWIFEPAKKEYQSVGIAVPHFSWVGDIFDISKHLKFQTVSISCTCWIQTSCKKYTPPYIAYVFAPNTAHFLHFTPNPCHFWRRWQPLRWLTPLHVQGDCRGNTPGACEQHTSSHDLKYNITVSYCFPMFPSTVLKRNITASYLQTWNNTSKPHDVGWKAGCQNCHSITQPQQARKSCQQDEAVLKATSGCFQLILPLYLAIEGVNGRHDVYTFAKHEMVKSWKVSKAPACCRYLMMF